MIAPTIMLLAAALSTTARAGATAEERAACRADAVKFCPRTLDGPTPFTVAACLAAHKEKLSPGCRAVIDARGL